MDHRAKERDRPEGYFSEDARRKRLLTKRLVLVDIKGIESLRASLRRIMKSRGIQTHGTDFGPHKSVSR